MPALYRGSAVPKGKTAIHSIKRGRLGANIHPKSYNFMKSYTDPRIWLYDLNNAMKFWVPQKEIFE